MKTAPILAVLLAISLCACSFSSNNANGQIQVVKQMISQSAGFNATVKIYTLKNTDEYYKASLTYQKGSMAKLKIIEPAYMAGFEATGGKDSQTSLTFNAAAHNAGDEKLGAISDVLTMPYNYFSLVDAKASAFEGYALFKLSDESSENYSSAFYVDLQSKKPYRVEIQEGSNTFIMEFLAFEYI